jgi:hypothetical protein
VPYRVLRLPVAQSRGEARRGHQFRLRLSPRSFAWWIVLAVFDVIGADSLTIIEAMGLRDPAVNLRSADEITAEIDERRSREIAENVIDGSVAALQWLLGDLRQAPGSRVNWPDGPVTAAHADAERHLLSGLFYDFSRIDQQGFSCGAELALDWALGREDAL